MTTLQTEVRPNSLYVGLSYCSEGGSLSRFDEWQDNLSFTYYWVDHINDITRYDWTPQGVRITPQLDASFVFVDSVGLDLNMAPTRGNWAFFRFRNLSPPRRIPEILSDIARSQRCANSCAWGFTFLSRLMEWGILRVAQTELRDYWSYIVDRTIERYVSPYLRDHHCLPRDFTEFGRRRASRRMH
ncbi:hypothetical protein Moror_1269 [Moniliophthora roreri MCA 2997]|uniref:Uncharacterized protein n=1 Tax=Moniliophthora roreri (strain MCA 2997) TaxID=1381753 RepID=V2X4M3_MONRO|nr:hypothetical protein Moror_1269 [Moniliophthora roreri MCA 2997]